MRKWFPSLFLLLFLYGVASAETKWVPYHYFNNSGGLNDGYSDTSIADNEASDLQNAVFTVGGDIKKRDGFTRINTSASVSGTITGLSFYKQADGDRFLVAVTSNGNIHKMDYTGLPGNPDGTWDIITGSASFSTTQDSLADFALAEDLVLIEDGVGTTPPLRWNGSGAVIPLGGGSPNATMVAYHKLHAFAAGDSTNPSRLYASNLGAVTTWTAADTIDVETNDGSIIRDIEPGLDALYIWKDRSIWRLSGTDKDNFILERMVDGVGTLSRRSVAKIDNLFFFVTNQGDIALYDGGINVKIISNKIQGSIDEANFDRFRFSPGVAFDSDYYLSYTTTGGSQHNRIFMFDTLHTAWTKFKGIGANAFTVAEDGYGKEFLVFGDYSGFANKYPDGTSDVGNPIDFFWVSKQFNYPELAQVGGGVEKIWRLIRVFANQEGNYNLDVEARSDFEITGVITTVNLLGGQAIWDTAIFDSATYATDSVIVGRIEVDKGKDFFQVKFANNGASQPITIRGYQNFLEPTFRL